MSQFFSYALCHYYCCCYSLVSYLIAVSSKMLFQPVIFAFAPPILNFILPQWEVGGENREARAAHGLGSLSGGTVLGSTIPKP